MLFEVGILLARADSLNLVGDFPEIAIYPISVLCMYAEIQ